MAYIDQDKKAALAPAIKAILGRYGLKGSLSVRHHSTLVLNIASGPIDFIGSVNRVAMSKTCHGDGRLTQAKDSLDVNCYWYQEHYDGEALAFLSEVIPVMNEGNHDRSDIMTDYFDVGWYVDVKIGRWDKPYQLTGQVDVRVADPEWEKRMLTLTEKEAE